MGEAGTDRSIVIDQTLSPTGREEAQRVGLRETTVYTGSRRRWPVTLHTGQRNRNTFLLARGAYFTISGKDNDSTIACESKF